MATDVAVVQIIERHTAQSAIVRQRVLDYIARQWRGMSSWRDADIERFVAQIVPVVEAGQVQIAALTDSYLATLETVVRGETIRPIGVPADVVNDLAMRGVPTSEVYGRSGPTVWTELSKGSDLVTATSRAFERISATAVTDLQLAHTHSARHVLDAKPYVVGHRRVLTGSTSCRLCVTAALQRYRKAELQPIHVRCDCKVVPILASADPGRTLNQELLAELKRNGQAGDLALTQAVTRHRKAVTKADETIDSLRGEIASTDPGQRRRLEAQLRDTEERKRIAEAKLQRSRDQLDDYRGVNGKPKTVYVHDHGELGPMLTDAEHKFTGPADIG